MNDNQRQAEAARSAPWWRSIGPGIITASVVFGPGSLLVSSKVGAAHGYHLVWLVGVVVLLMGSYLIMAARIGISGAGTPSELVAQHLGRPLAVIIGLAACGVCSAFQAGNNLAIAAAVDNLGAGARFANVWLLPLLNIAAVVFLFAFKRLYKHVERFMMVLVGVMMVAFLFNLVKVLSRGPIAPAESATVDDPVSWMLIAGFFGTSFSVVGAYYQATLVREKGWKAGDMRKGLADAIAGVCALGGISLIIMLTAGTVLRGQETSNVGQLALQLEPLLGPAAHVLFCIGLLAAALSSVLVNAMIGGNLLADGLGLSSRIDDRWPRLLTVMVLLIGMTVAMLVLNAGISLVNAIVVGQALTVLGNPLVAGVILWLANRPDIVGQRRNGPVLNVLGAAGFLLVLALAVNVLIGLLQRLAGA